MVRDEGRGSDRVGGASTTTDCARALVGEHVLAMVPLDVPKSLFLFFPCFWVPLSIPRPTKRPGLSTDHLSSDHQVKMPQEGCYLPEETWGLVLEYASASDTIAMRRCSRSGREVTRKTLAGLIATACSDGRAYVWNAETGALLLTLEGSSNRHWVRRVAFSERGDLVFTSSADGTARTFDAKTGELLKCDFETIEETEDHRRRDKFAMSPDGRRRVTSSPDAKTPRLLDAQTGLLQKVLKGHKNIVESFVFSPDNKRIVTSSFDSTARLWDACSGQPLGILKHKNRFNGRQDLFVLACDFTMASHSSKMRTH